MFPICTVSQTIALEQGAMEAGTPHEELMTRAGEALWRATHELGVEQRLPETPWLILAGPGNNGGDGLSCAAARLEAGGPARIYAWRRRSPGADPLRQALPEGAEVADAEADPHFCQLKRWLMTAHVVIDCLLGTGRSRPAGGTLAGILETVRAGLTDRHYIVAADCPSGADCDNGSVDPLALTADLTVMFGTAKRGLYRDPARTRAGRMMWADIGIRHAVAADSLGGGLQASDLPELLPVRSDQSHKGTFGKVLCIVGSRRYPGAASLAARSAARAGAGLVCAAVPASIQSSLVPAMSDITFLPYCDTEVECGGAASSAAIPLVTAESRKYSSLLLGCGLSHTPQTQEFVQGFLAYWRDLGSQAPCLVIDADGLNCLAALGGPSGKMNPRAILTPHLAEMGRLCGLETSEVVESAPELAVEKSRDWNCTVILKGPQTWIGTPGGDLYAMLDANSALATAGTGDVLAGILAGMLAQGADESRAARSAVLIHSLAGRRCSQELGPAGTLASDLLNHVPMAIRDYAPRKPRHALADPAARGLGKSETVTHAS